MKQGTVHSDICKQACSDARSQTADQGGGSLDKRQVDEHYLREGTTAEAQLELQKDGVELQKDGEEGQGGGGWPGLEGGGNSTLRGSLVWEVWKEEGAMGCTFKKAPMAPRYPSCLRNSAAISPYKTCTDKSNAPQQNNGHNRIVDPAATGKLRTASLSLVLLVEA